MLIVIDNYDSFTYNLAQYLLELGAQVEVVKNDALSLQELVDRSPQGLLISPGPCDPSSAGISIEAVRAFSGRIPILGVCLGHQVIAEVFGGAIIRAAEVIHGKTSKINHDQRGVFAGLPVPFQATRYHSLAVDQEALPESLEVSAWTEVPKLSVQPALAGNSEVMGIRHRKYQIEGVQFHPESILSEHGHALLNNFLKYLREPGICQAPELGE